jgi:hypothetical protein
MVAKRSDPPANVSSHDAAKVLGRLGGLKGGARRAKRLPKEQRQRIASMGGTASAKSLSKAERIEKARRAGLARAAKGPSLTAEQRIEIARKAALARWRKG